MSKFGFLTYLSSLRNFAALPLLLFVFVLMPSAGIYSYFHIKNKQPLRPKRHRLAVAIIFQVAGLAIALLTAGYYHILLFPSSYPNPLASGAVFLYMLLILYRISASLPKAKREKLSRMRRSLPEYDDEVKLWVMVSVAAGVAEEVVYRGVAYALVLSVTGSVVLSVAICSIAFGVAHAMQGWGPALSVALFGVGFHIAAIGTGSLYLGMLLHVGYDIGLGLIAFRFFRLDTVRKSITATS